MSKETLQQIAQRLYDEGRLNMEKGLYAFGVSRTWKTPQEIIHRLLAAKDERSLPRLLKVELHEAYAALAALDGSIPVWRDARTHRPAAGKQCLSSTRETLES